MRPRRCSSSGWPAGSLAVGPVAAPDRGRADSTAIRTLNAVLPPPDRDRRRARALLDDSGLPDVFVGFEPLPRPPVDPPTDATRPADRRAIAQASTVRVLGRRLRGDRARAVASSSRTATSSPTPTSSPARAPARSTCRPSPASRSTPASSCSTRRSTSRSCGRRTCARAPLRFATSDPERGTVGAALGYPGGGQLTIVPAAVTGAYPATGRDIYGEAPGRSRHPGAPRPDRPRRQRRPVRAAGRDDRRPRSSPRRGRIRTSATRSARRRSRSASRRRSGGPRPSRRGPACAEGTALHCTSCPLRPSSRRRTRTTAPPIRPSATRRP